MSVAEKQKPRFAVDIDAREAEIAGKPQRISAVSPDKIDAVGLDFYASISASFGIPDRPTEVPESYRLWYHNLDVFRAFTEMVLQLLTKGTLPARERELAIIRILWLAGSPNPFGEHVDFGKAVGLTPVEIERALEGSAAAGWGELDKAVLASAEQIFERQAVSDETWAVLEKYWNEAQLIEYPIMIGQYIASAIMHNTLRTVRAAHNNGLRHR